MLQLQRLLLRYLFVFNLLAVDGVLAEQPLDKVEKHVVLAFDLLEAQLSLIVPSGFLVNFLQGHRGLVDIFCLHLVDFTQRLVQLALGILEVDLLSFKVPLHLLDLVFESFCFLTGHLSAESLCLRLIQPVLHFLDHLLLSDDFVLEHLDLFRQNVLFIVQCLFAGFHLVHFLLDLFAGALLLLGLLQQSLVLLQLLLDRLELYFQLLVIILFFFLLVLQVIDDFFFALGVFLQLLYLLLFLDGRFLAQIFPCARLRLHHLLPAGQIVGAEVGVGDLTAGHDVALALASIGL